MSCPDSNFHPIQFTTSFDGEIDALRAVLDANTPAIVFQRVAAAQLRDPAFLQRLAGKYDMEGGVATFSLEGSRLVVTLPGQRYELEPTNNLQFNLKSLAGYSVRFVLNDQDMPTAVRFLQPNGVFEGKRKPD